LHPVQATALFGLQTYVLLWTMSLLTCGAQAEFVPKLMQSAEDLQAHAYPACGLMQAPPPFVNGVQQLSGTAQSELLAHGLAQSLFPAGSTMQRAPAEQHTESHGVEQHWPPMQTCPVWQHLVPPQTFVDEQHTPATQVWLPGHAPAGFVALQAATGVVQTPPTQFCPTGQPPFGLLGLQPPPPAPQAPLVQAVPAAHAVQAIPFVPQAELSSAPLRQMPAAQQPAQFDELQEGLSPLQPRHAASEPPISAVSRNDRMSPPRRRLSGHDDQDASHL
jgi:hypothetical protein